MQKGFVQFIILGIVVLAIVAAGAFYIGRQTSKPVQPQISIAQPTISQTSPSPTPDETAYWKTYTDNKDEEYTVKYPTDIFVEQREVNCPRESSDFSLYKKQKEKIDCKSFNADSYPEYLNIFIGAGMDQTIGANNPCVHVTREQIKIGGLPASKITSTFDTKSQECRNKEWLAYVDKVASKGIQIFAGSPLTLMYITYSIRDIPEDVIDKIISTIKFTNQNQDEMVRCVKDTQKLFGQSKYVRGYLLVGFKTASKEEAQAIIKSYGLDFDSSYDSKGIQPLTLYVKVPVGEEFKWKCKLDPDLNVHIQTVSLNFLLNI